MGLENRFLTQGLEDNGKYRPVSVQSKDSKSINDRRILQAYLRLTADPRAKKLKAIASLVGRLGG